MNDNLTSVEDGNLNYNQVMSNWLRDLGEEEVPQVNDNLPTLGRAIMSMKFYDGQDSPQQREVFMYVV